jgi:hypothetical protein
MEPTVDGHPHLDALYAAYGLESASDRAAVQDAYDVFREHHAPFVTSIAAEMLDDLRADVAAGPDAHIVFLGRDGKSLSVATHALDQEFFEAHCHDTVLSRALVEAAVQDQERNGEQSYPQIAGFRGTGNTVAEADIDGAYQRLTRHLHTIGIPVGKEGTRITLVDSCLKGTVQELMAAVYPKTEFTGRLMFFDGIAGDPHPGSKQGYALHRDAGVGGGMTTLPDDPALTFGSLPAIRVIENALQGPLSSPRRMNDDGPEQTRLMDIPDRTWGCNPVLVAEPYRNPAVREAVKVAALLAVQDCALAVRDGMPLDTPRIRERFTEQTRAWLTRSDQVDPGLKTVLDSFVHRDDHRLVRQLDDEMQKSRFTPDVSRQLWVNFERASTQQDKMGLIERIQEARTKTRSPGGAGGTGGQDAAKRPPQGRSPGARPGPDRTGGGRR